MQDILKQLALEKVKSNSRFAAMDSKEVYDLFMSIYYEFLSYAKESNRAKTSKNIQDFYNNRSNQ